MRRKMLRVLQINISGFLAQNRNQKNRTMVPLLFVIALSLVGPCFCAPLKSKSPVFKLTNSDFDHFLKDKDVMLVDFYAPW